MKKQNKHKKLLIYTAITVLTFAFVASLILSTNKGENLTGYLKVKPSAQLQAQSPQMNIFPSPGSPINRAELAKLIAVTQGVDVSGYTGCAPDVPAGAWFENYICYMKATEVYWSFPDGNLYPYNTVMRGEGAKFFAVAFLNDFTAPSQQLYPDVQPQEWYFSWINLLAVKKITDVKPGLNQKFYPGDTLTHSQAQTWIKNVKMYVL